MKPNQRQFNGNIRHSSLPTMQNEEKNVRNGTKINRLIYWRTFRSHFYDFPFYTIAQCDRNVKPVIWPASATQSKSLETIVINFFLLFFVFRFPFRSSAVALPCTYVPVHDNNRAVSVSALISCLRNFVYSFFARRS